MKKRIKVASIFMLAGILAACGSNETDTTVPKKEQSTETKSADAGIAATTLIDELTIYSSIKAELDKAKDGQAMDWKMVKTSYEAKLKGGVKTVAPEIDQVIQSALIDVEAKNLDQNIARQLVDKGLQSYFYQLQKATQAKAEEALVAGKPEAATEALKDVEAMAKTVFIPTAKKCDVSYDFKNEDAIAQAITSGLSAQQEAIDTKKIGDFNVAKQVTDKSIYRSFYLAALDYAQKIEDGVKSGTDEKELQVGQAEGYASLLAVEKSLADGEEETVKILKERYDFSKTKPADVSYKEIEGLFAQALTEKVDESHEETQEAIEKKDIDTARAKAMEANLFIVAMKPTLENRLGKEKVAQITKDANEWFALVEKGDVKAKMIGERITDALKPFN